MVARNSTCTTTSETSPRDRITSHTHSRLTGRDVRPKLAVIPTERSTVPGTKPSYANRHYRRSCGWGQR